MRRELKRNLSILIIALTVLGTAPWVLGRGGGGGGGGARVSGGGGGMSRPSPSVGRSPSFSRPSTMPTRPSGGGNISRPSGGVSRPSVGTRPSTPSSRPSTGLTPGSRPGSVDFARPATLPSFGARPGTLPNSPRPGIGNPGISQLPAGQRPGIGQLPAGQRPGISQLPAGQRPGVGAPGIGTRPSFPGGSTALLPGLGNRPGFDGNRPSQLPARGGNIQDRQNNLQDRLSSRDQIRDDFQNNRDQIREDWHDNYHNYHNHDHWHHGFWHGNAGDMWHHMWDDHTAFMAFRTTMWGINRAAYGFGYWGYSNPYYVESYPIGGGAVIDYSQPMIEEVPVSDVPTEAPPAEMTDFDAARQAFYQGDYAAAMAATNKALAVQPNDAIIHEFRSLILFAQGKYRESAAGLYSVLSVGPGWDWTTLISLYPDVDTYTKQLRALEARVQQQPTAGDARFVLAYQYLTMGNKDAAVGQLQELQKTLPEDKLVKELLLMTGGPDAIGAKPAPTVAEDAPAPPAVPAASLVGNWSATGQGNTKFQMALTDQGSFTWNYAQGGKSQVVKGVYAVDGNVLALEPESGGVMLAEVTPPNNNNFQFQLLGTPPGDPGLKFVKSR